MHLPKSPPCGTRAQVFNGASLSTRIQLLLRFLLLPSVCIVLSLLGVPGITRTKLPFFYFQYSLVDQTRGQANFKSQAENRPLFEKHFFKND